MRFVGLELDRKTDIIALAAFMLALGGIVFQVYGFLRGARVTLFPPGQVTIMCYSYIAGDCTSNTPGEKYVRFATRMAYVNTGELPYNSIIKSEAISFNLSGQTYKQEWQEFRSFTAVGAKLQSKDEGIARPLPITGGSSLAHETYFAPHIQRCFGQGTVPCTSGKNFLKFEDFLSELSKTGKIQFRLEATLYDKAKPLQVSCTADVDDKLINLLRTRGWSGPDCWPELE